MSGVLFMMRLWKYVDTKKLDNKSKANIFLIMNIILWSGIAFLLSLIAGVFCGYSAEIQAGHINSYLRFTKFHIFRSTSAAVIINSSIVLSCGIYIFMT